MAIAQLKDAARREIMAAYWAYRARLEDAGGEGTRPRFVYRYNHQQEPLPEWVREAFPTLTLITLDHWIGRQKNFGDKGLTSDYGNRLGSGFYGTHPAAAKVIKGLLRSNPQVTADEALQAVKRQFKSAKYPTLRATQRYLRTLRAASGLQAPKGRPPRPSSRNRP